MLWHPAMRNVHRLNEEEGDVGGLQRLVLGRAVQCATIVDGHERFSCGILGEGCYNDELTLIVSKWFAEILTECFVVCHDFRRSTVASLKIRYGQRGDEFSEISEKESRRTRCS